MKEPQKKFIDWYKTTKEFLDIPEAEKPIHLAMMIKKTMNLNFKKNERNIEKRN